MPNLLRFTRFQHLRSYWRNSFFLRVVQQYSVGLGVGSFVILLAAIGVGHLVPFGTHSDVFLPYEAILPGAPQEALTSFDCQFIPNIERGQVVESSVKKCNVLPGGDSLYHLITVMTQNDRVVEVTFFSADLQFSDLLQRWGDPDTILRSENGSSFTMLWDEANYNVVAVLSQPLRSSVVRMLELKQK